MTNISKEFTYKLADEMFVESGEQNRTTTLTYNGPEKIYLVVDSSSNKLTGSDIDPDRYDTYNDSTEGSYAVEIDCNEDTLVCAIWQKHGFNDSKIQEIEETIEGNLVPYKYNEPAKPIETYELTEIEYDPITQKFKKPFPWKKPEMDWDILFNIRQVSIAASDVISSEDLPASLATKVSEYRTYLRDFPEIYGASWTITFDNGGSGYSVGDKISINDPRYKNDQPANEILIEVTSVDGSGSVTSFKKVTHSKAFYHPAAGSYSNVYYTTNGNGTGATVSVSKKKLVPAWKVNMQEPPLG